jgi:four helix bundle protein
MSGTYTDLQAWQAAMDLAEEIYRITKSFPKEETYGLTIQLRRAAVSVPSNIAEGKGRSSDKELSQFLCHSRGSLFEIETQINLARRLGYLHESEAEAVLQKTVRVGPTAQWLAPSFPSAKRCLAHRN